MDVIGVMRKVDDFIELKLSPQIANYKNKEIIVSFKDILDFDSDLAEQFLDDFYNVDIQFYNSLSERLNDAGVEVRYKDLPEETKIPLWKIRHKHVGKIVHAEGYIRKIGGVNHIISWKKFECANCGATKSINQIPKPIKPSKCGCGCKIFRTIEQRQHDIQKVVLEEDREDLSSDQTPERKLILLTKGLTNPALTKKIQPSVKLRIVGIVREEQKNPEKPEFYTYIEANNIEFMEDDRIILSKEDLFEIDKVSKTEFLMEDMARSISPTTHGMEDIRKAIFLQLIGAEHVYEKNMLVERGTINILLAGSPGCMPATEEVWTPDGYKSIKEVHAVYSLDTDGNIVEAISFPVYTGKKNIVKIETTQGDIQCSNDHLWFVIRNDNIRLIETKDLNTRDLLLLYDKNNLSSMPKGIYGLQGKEVLFNNLRSENNFPKTDGQKQSLLQRIRYGKNKRTVSKGILCNKDWANNGGRSSHYNKEIKGDEYSSKRIQSPSLIRDSKKHSQMDKWSLWERISSLQTWKMCRTNIQQKRIFKNCQRKLSLDMYELWTKFNQDGSYSPPQGWEQYSQQSRKFDGIVSIVPCNITRITQNEEQVDMYDLMVPNHHNFFLKNGILSHNCNKTVLIRKATQFVPRARYVGSSTASGVGLVASVKKDEELGDYSVEPGAIPLANGSLLSLDETDKIKKEDIGYMNIAIDKLEVPIDKANVHVVLKTDTAILAAANPKHRVFDERDTYISQVDLPKDFMDRFDLIFCIPSIKVESDQRLIADMIFSKYGNGMQSNLNKVYDTEFVKKFVFRAKQIKPTLSKEAMETLKEEFIRIVKPGSEDEGAYFSSRMLMNLIRLSISSAKAHLRDIVTREDAMISVELMQAALKSCGLIKDNILNVTGYEQVTDKNKRDQYHTIIAIIRDLSVNGDAKFMDIVTKAKEFNITEDKVDELLVKMSTNGEIFSPRRGEFKLA